MVRVGLNPRRLFVFRNSFIYILANLKKELNSSFTLKLLYLGNMRNKKRFLFEQKQS
jgi:hypothetical protein